MSGGTNVGALVASLGLDTGEFERALNNANSAMGRASNEINRALGRTQTQMTNVGKSMTKVGKSASLYLTTPLLAAGVASFKMASDLNESINKVDVAFKKDAATVKAWAKTSLEAYGISEGAALDMSAMFGDMATSMGLSTGAAAAMSTSLTGLAGDLASFKNINISEAQTALAAVFTGETESLKRLGIVITEANLQEYAYTQGIRKKIQAMSQAEKVQLRYNYVLSTTKNAQGDFQRTNEGAANQMRIFMESLKEVAASLGQVLLPIITPVIKKINEMLKWVSSLTDTQKQWVVGIAAAAAAIGPLLLMTGKMVTAFPSIIKGWQGVTTAAVYVKDAFIKMSAALAVNPWVLLAAAVVAAGAAIYMYTRNSEEAVSVSSDFSNNLRKEVGAVEANFAALKGTAAGTDSRRIAIENINAQYKDYLPNLLNEKSSLEDIEAAQKKVTAAMANAISLKSQQAGLQKFADASASATEDYASQLAKFFDNKKVSDEVRGAAGAAMDAYVEELGKTNISAASRMDYSMMADLFRNNGVDLSVGGAESLLLLSDAVKEVIDAKQKEYKATEDLKTVHDAYLKKLGIEVEGETKSSAAILSTTGYIAEKTGKLNKLAEQMESLEKLKKESNDDASIAKYNGEIQAIKNQIDELESLGTVKGKQKLLNEELAKQNKIISDTGQSDEEIKAAQLKALSIEREITALGNLAAAEKTANDYQAEMGKADTTYQLTGDKVQYLTAQLNAAQTAMTAMIDAGVGPGDTQLQGYAASVKSLTAELSVQTALVEQVPDAWEDYNAAMARANEGMTKYGDNSAAIEDKLNATTTMMESLKEAGLENSDMYKQLALDVQAYEAALKASQDTVINWQGLHQDACQGVGQAFMELAETGRTSIKSLIRALMSQVVAQLIAKIVTSVPFPASLFVAAGAGAMAGGLMAAIPEFADGGIVSGPTLGVMGEYAGAKSNPEVIAPLNKLKGLIGDAGSSSGGEVQFRIEGTTLVGVLNRYGKKINSYS